MGRGKRLAPPLKGAVHVHDLRATTLHLLGPDHEELTDRDSGRDVRLTDVKGNVVRAILARTPLSRPER